MRIDVQTYRVFAQMGARIRIEVDGEDVTNQCFAADDVEGWADCYVCDEDGRRIFQRSSGLPAAQRRTGVVRIINTGEVTIQ